MTICVAITNTKTGAKRTPKDMLEEIRTVDAESIVHSFSGLYRNVDNSWTKSLDYKRAEQFIVDSIESGETVTHVFSRKDTWFKTATEWGPNYDWKKDEFEYSINLGDFGRPVIDKETVYLPDYSELTEKSDEDAVIYSREYMETLNLCITLMRRYGDKAPKCWFIQDGNKIPLNDFAKKYLYENRYNFELVDGVPIYIWRRFVDEGITGEVFDTAYRKGYFWHMLHQLTMICPDDKMPTYFREQNPEGFDEAISTPGNDWMLEKYLAVEDKDEENIGYRPIDSSSKRYVEDENPYLDFEYDHCGFCGRPITRRIYLESRKYILAKQKEAETKMKELERYNDYIERCVAAAKPLMAAAKNARAAKRARKINEPEPPKGKTLNYLEVRKEKVDTPKQSTYLLKQLKAAKTK